MKKTTSIMICFLGFVEFSFSQSNSFPLFSNGSYSGGSGDYTDITNAQLKLQSTSGYVRVNHLSSTSSVSAVYNFQSGKNVYWGEGGDQGSYLFRGRNLIVQNGNLGVGTTSPSTKLDILQSGGSTGTESALRLRAGNTSSYSGNNQILMSFESGTLYSHAIKTRHNSSQNAGNSIDFYLWNTNDQSAEVGTMHVMSLNGGNVGIGTTTPDAKLEIEDSQSGALTIPLKLVNQAKIDNTEVGIDFDGARVSDNEQITLARILQRRSSSMAEYSGNLLLKVHDGTAGLTTRLRINGDGEHLFYDQAQNEVLRIDNQGSVGIGTSSPDAKLAVNGTIHSKEVVVDLNGWPAPDFVFEEDYKLKSLEETEEYIEANKHLPEIPSASEMEENGFELKEMNLKLLQKVEELTLHLIEQNKKIKNLEKKLERLEGDR